MSTDSYIWAPAGVRNDKSNSFRKYKAWEEMITVESATVPPHQVFLAQGGNILVDEQYFFESADDARWFWSDGFNERLYLNEEGAHVPFDRMALWIDGEEVDSRGYAGISRG